MHFRSVFHVAAAIVLAGSSGAPAFAAANLTVDGSKTFQAITGMGVNINVESWKAGQLKPALDLLVNPAGATNAAPVFRVIRDPMTWVSNEADIAPLHNLDAATLTRIYEQSSMQDLWSTIAYLNSKGVKGTQIVLNFMGWTPVWLGGSGRFGSPSYVTTGKESEFATLVASLVYYGRRVKGLDFTLLAPVNEMDHNCLEGPCMSANQYATVMHALVAELNGMGLVEIRLVGPDTANPTASDAYISAVMSDATVASRMDHFGIHIYGSSTGPRTPYPGHDYWLTETAAVCSACDAGGAPSQGEWTFSSEGGEYTLGSLQQGMAGILFWDGYDSYYYHHNAVGTYGLLAYDQGTGTYTPRKRYFVDAQIYGFIPRGAVRVAESDAISALGSVPAFFDAASGRLTLVGQNQSSSAVTISGQLNNLPAIGELMLFTTDAGSANLKRGTNVTVASGAFTVTIPASTFFTLAGGTGTAPPANTAPIAAATAAPRSGSAPLAVSFSGAGSSDSDGDSLTYAWTFGDGATAIGRLASHTYASAGNFTAILTVNDGRSGSDTASVGISVTAPSGAPGFPVTPVLDDFNRPDGPVGPNWIDQTSSYAISANALAPSSGDVFIEWGRAVFGVDQEAFVTLRTISASARENNLMLKTQGTTWNAGHIEVSYSTAGSSVAVVTFTPPSTWHTYGTISGVTFAAGNQFGARARNNGTVEVYKNGVLLGSVSVAGWPFAALGGRIGLSVSQATATRFDDFGGGNVSAPNTPPVASIVAPANNSFYYTGQIINLSGTATDAESPSNLLTYNWVVDLVFGGHVQPGYKAFTGATAAYVGADVNDGTGVRQRIKLTATDPQGLASDTVTATIWPEIDLVPSAVTVSPDPPIAGQSAHYTFRLSNTGRMSAQPSHWMLRAGNTVLGQGDASVPASGSIDLSADAAISNSGMLNLRLVSDSLAAVVETNETNNASVRTLTVNSPPTPSPSFPQTPVLDSFNRPDGAVGGSWIDQTSAFTINANALALSSSTAYIEWNGAAFGPNQEVFVTLKAINTSAPEQNLMLKTQGTTWTSGHIEVSYSAAGSSVGVNTFTPPSSWKSIRTFGNVSFAPGDRFGARALSDGTVQVYKNGSLIGSTSVAGWPYASTGGRIGISSVSAASSRYDDFGGGDYTGPSVLAGEAPISAQLSLSNALPNPSPGAVSFSLELPQSDDVSFTILDVQGREVWSAPERRYAAGRWSLRWDGNTRRGTSTAGVFFARVRVGSQQFLRRIAIVR